MFELSAEVELEVKFEVFEDDETDAWVVLVSVIATPPEEVLASAVWETIGVVCVCAGISWVCDCAAWVWVSLPPVAPVALLPLINDPSFV